MTRYKVNARGLKQHAFRNKLLLNQSLISLFGIDPLEEKYTGQASHRPFHDLAEPLRQCPEGLGYDNLHHFYHTLVDNNLFRNELCTLNKEQILAYEENIVRHTQTINEKRYREVVWKYYQWLTLLFVEIYLDRFFSNREHLQQELNTYVERFNQRWTDYAPVFQYGEDDLNKLCLQNATGSGKTLLMHINLLQYRYYAQKHGRDKELSRVILLTPNERLSEQHLAEFRERKLRLVLISNRELVSLV